jgi:hypothetical protein
MRRRAVLEEAPVLALDTCPQMQQFIEQLATKHQVDLSIAGIRLWLALPGTTERILIAGLSGQRIGITHCVANAAEQLVCDTDLVCLVDEAGWQPIELLHTDAVWAAYVRRMAATGEVQIFDEVGEIRLPHFVEYWASTLEQQYWLDQSQRLRV